MLIRISLRSYRAYYPYILLSLYWYFLSYTYSERTLLADLFLFRSLVGHIFILISRRTHTYIDFRVCRTELIHILIRRYLSTYSYLYLSQISRRSSQNLCLYSDTYTCTGAYIYLRSPVGVHRTYAYTEILIHVLVLISISDLP